MEFYCKSGERIHVDILGEGFPIVFLHGNNLQSSYFAKQRVLEKSFQLLFVDSLGHGKSGELQGETSFAYLADSLEELLSSLSIEKCLLVGHSDGANLALEYAGRHGERVAGILANSGNITFSGLKFLPRYACYLEEWLYRFLGLFLPAFKRKSRVSPLLRENVDVPKELFRKAPYPVVVLVGDRDMIKRKHSMAIAKLFPKGKFLERKGQGHNIPKKDSAYFNHLIEKMVSVVRRKN